MYAPILDNVEPNRKSLMDPNLDKIPFFEVRPEPTIILVLVLGPSLVIHDILTYSNGICKVFESAWTWQPIKNS